MKFNQKKILSSIKHIIEFAIENKATAVRVNLADILEAVHEIPAAMDVTKPLDKITHRDVHAANNGHANVVALKNEMDDVLTLVEIVGKYGEWVVASEDFPNYLFVSVRAQTIVTL